MIRSPSLRWSTKFPTELRDRNALRFVPDPRFWNILWVNSIRADSASALQDIQVHRQYKSYAFVWFPSWCADHDNCFNSHHLSPLLKIERSYDRLRFNSERSSLKKSTLKCEKCWWK
jgi:hypothetical protein